MKTIIFIIFLSICSFSKDKINVENKKVNETKILSKKEKAYQERLKKLEIENKKLEDDGFCSCNND